MAKVLITGGAGFIGSHIVEALIEEGHDAIIIDNLSTGKKSNISPKAKFYDLDLRDKKMIDDIFKKEKPDVVNHHAAHLEVQSSLDDPAKDAEINIIGTINLLGASVKHKVKHFIFASSAAVYGDGIPPLSEETILSPISPYGIAKMACESYIKNFNMLKSLPYTILRYSNVYGPRQKLDGEAAVVPTFFNSMINADKNSQCLKIFGDGSQTRDFIYVEDVAELNMIITSSPLNTICNIGTGIKTSVDELFKIIKDTTCFEGDKKHTKRREGDIQDSWLDCRKIKKLCNWKAKTDLKEGLKKTYGRWQLNR